ncbi:MAG: ATP-binding protein [Candidatus Sedimenticola sp. (ex Thyasira tokunagai)]
MLLLLALVLVSLHFMSGALQSREELSRLFIPLLLASVLGLFSLIVVVGVNIVQLVLRYRRQATGSRLTLRIVAMFVVISLAPVAVVYYYSQQFLMQGVDSWFDVQIDQAMEDALSLSKASLDLYKRERLKTTAQLLAEVSGSSILGISLSLDDLRERFGASELVLLELSGRVIASVNADPGILVPRKLDTVTLQQVRRGSDFVTLEPSGDGAGPMEVRVVVGDALRGRILQASYPTSANLTELTERVQGAYSRYKELSFLRKSLKNTFTMALAMVLLFSLLAAIWLAFFTARRLVAPIAEIADGTRAVAQGDYDKQLTLPKTGDELGFLVSSFNAMTRRIALSRDEAARSQLRVEAQHAYLETVLGRLSSGVVALDADGRIRTANQAACDILQVDLLEFSGRSLELLAEVSQPLSQFVDTIKGAVEADLRDWREQVTLFGGEGRQVLLCRGTPLAQPDDKSEGYGLVFDDITTLITAQRDAAWGEVARRLAHEIKNPLTPIQLSAERLRHRYLKTMQGKDAEVMDRATHTIVQQVDAMKDMVNAFSDYARPPKMNLEPLVFDSLALEVLDLYHSAGFDSELEIDLQAQGLQIEADPGRLRQVLHNLIKNAREAVVAVDAPWIQVASHGKEDAGHCFIELRVTDNGPGFDEETIGRLFEPYVTTKTKGTGLGLAVVKKIVEEHGGIVWAENRPERGACVVLRLPVTGRVEEIPERREKA